MLTTIIAIPVIPPAFTGLTALTSTIAVDRSVTPWIGSMTGTKTALGILKEVVVLCRLTNMQSETDVKILVTNDFPGVLC